jgi:hypothetical protein
MEGVRNKVSTAGPNDPPPADRDQVKAAREAKKAEKAAKKAGNKPLTADSAGKQQPVKVIQAGIFRIFYII